jgi:branched-chain amino acid transport system ATP-binding protein
VSVLNVNSELTAETVEDDTRPILEVSELKAGYGSKPVVFDAHFKAQRGEVIGIIGHNGAGKSTTLSAVYGSLKPTGGEVRFRGRVVTGRTPRRNVRDGMTLLRSERFTFGELSVHENLLLGGLFVKASERDARMGEVYDLFPILKEREHARAQQFSGGQQRLLSIGMALVASPEVMLLDEPSLGIAPALTARIFDTIKQLTVERSIAVVIVEQNLKELLRIADRIYVMRSGRIILEESAEQMSKRATLWDLF